MFWLQQNLLPIPPLRNLKITKDLNFGLNTKHLMVFMNSVQK